MDYINAFWVGGLICALTQILMEKTKLMPGRIMVLLVCTGAVLGAVGIYEPFQKYAGAGASVPLLGFGNVLWKGVKEEVMEEGLLGIFKGGFSAGSAGTCAALGAAGAARLLLTGHAPETVALRTPKGIVVEVEPIFCRLSGEGPSAPSGRTAATMWT